jgi:hypothetical protein
LGNILRGWDIDRLTEHMKLIDLLIFFLFDVPRFLNTLGSKNNFAVLLAISVGVVLDYHRLRSNLSTGKMPRRLNHWSSICHRLLDAAIYASGGVKNRH